MQKQTQRLDDDELPDGGHCFLKAAAMCMEETVVLSLTSINHWQLLQS